ncbi:MAG: hypothetical protein AAGE61_17230 [Pseudomonadota bacterium]
MSEISGINSAYLPASWINSSGELTVTKQQAETFAAGIQSRIADMPEAEKGIFLAMLKSPNFTPAADPSNSNTAAALDAFEEAASRLADLPFVADVAKLLARAMVENAGQQRKEALNQRLSSRLEAKEQLDRQAGDLSAAADKMRTGAITALVLTVVTAVVSIVMSAVSLRGMKGNMAELKNAGQQTQQATQLSNQAAQTSKIASNTSGTAATKLNTQAAQMSNQANEMNVNAKISLETVSASSAKAQQTASMGGAIGGMGSSSAGAVQSLTGAQAKDLEADASEEAAEAELTKSEADVDREVQQALDEFMKHLINFIKELRDAEVEQMAAVTKG